MTKMSALLFNISLEALGGTIWQKREKNEVRKGRRKIVVGCKREEAGEQTWGAFVLVFVFTLCIVVMVWGMHLCVKHSLHLLQIHS